MSGKAVSSVWCPPSWVRTGAKAVSGMPRRGGLGLAGPHPSPSASQGGPLTPEPWRVGAVGPVWPGRCGRGWDPTELSVELQEPGTSTHTPRPSGLPCGLAGVQPFPLFCDTLRDAGPSGPLRPRMSPGLFLDEMPPGSASAAHGAPSTTLRPRAERARLERPGRAA